MTRHWTPLALVFLGTSILGLVGTWAFNIASILERRDYLGDWLNSGPSVSSLTTDLLIAVVAGSILIVVEARRLGIRHSWLYIVLTFVVAFAFAFPLFLAVRERKLEQLRRDGIVPLPGKP